MISKALRPICLIALLTLGHPAASGESAELAPEVIDAAWAAKWQEDLAFAKEKMPEVHIRIDHACTLTGAVR